MLRGLDKILLLCITIYFSDGTSHTFKEANFYKTDADIFRVAKVMKIYKVPGMHQVAEIPIDKIKMITEECK